MTDEEILERLAAIEKKQRFMPWKSVDLDSRTIYEGVNGFNPLTDDAQAMALLRKYMTHPENHREWEMWHAPTADGTFKFCVYTRDAEGERTVIDSSLNRAICLAVIAALEAKP